MRNCAFHSLVADELSNEVGGEGENQILVIVVDRLRKEVKSPSHETTDGDGKEVRPDCGCDGFQADEVRRSLVG
jgi:hypothetical protein